MTASRKEYLTDLLEDCDAVLQDFEGYDPECWEGSGKATVIAAMILADAMNGLRKGLLTAQGKEKRDEL
jgi:hypothetical protein